MSKPIPVPPLPERTLLDRTGLPETPDRYVMISADMLQVLCERARKTSAGPVTKNERVALDYAADALTAHDEDENGPSLETLLEALNVDSVTLLPDGSGFATGSFPLPKDHWLTAEGYNEPPTPFLLGTEQSILLEWDDGTTRRMTRKEFAEEVQKAARYAIRASTENGKIDDFDPDAMANNFIIGLLGVWTPDGRSQLT